MDEKKYSFIRFLKANNIEPNYGINYNNPIGFIYDGDDIIDVIHQILETISKQEWDDFKL